MNEIEAKRRVDRILAEAVGSDLTSWERHQFLPSVAHQFDITEAQERVLSGIERRLGLLPWCC